MGGNQQVRLGSTAQRRHAAVGGRDHFEPKVTLMRVALFWSVLLVATVSWTDTSRAGDTDELRLKRVDGTEVSADEMERYVAAVMDSAGVTGLQMAIINDGEVVYTHEFRMKSRAAGLAPGSETVFAGLGSPPG
jgi:CubicO group peptidase (beta-lactamase class C family)